MQRRPRTLRKGVAVGGFTIVELVIVLVIIGVLTALVFPSFMDAVRKGRRTEAFGKLNAVQLAQERWRANNAAYSAVLTSAPTASPPGLGIPATSADGRYALSIEADPATAATTYSATATAVSGSSQAADGSCAKLAVRIRDGNIEYGSAVAGGAPDYTAGNRCWAR